MATWCGVLASWETGADLAAIARRLDLEVLAEPGPGHLLVDCGAHFGVPARLAAALSRELGGETLGFDAQTASDAYQLDAFERGTPVRHLLYTRDDGGWVEVTGTMQPWEPAFFFDGNAASGDGEGWPDLLSDELDDESIARFEAARKAGNPSAVLDLLEPHSTAPLLRLCALWGVDAQRPWARWRKPSFLRRLWAR
jgi:hypothetical protein